MMEPKEIQEQLLNYLRRIASHFNIEGAEAVSFKKRSTLLDKIKEQDEAAWQAVSDVIDTQLRLDRILADKEKAQKNPEVWNTELEQAKGKRAEAGERLAAFFKAQGISNEGLPEAL